MTKLIPALCACLILAHLSLATNYTFHGSVDNMWHEPGNWSPTYPGLDITSGDVVQIQASCVVLSNLIRNYGTISITGSADITVESGGEFVNSGVISLGGELVIVPGGIMRNSTGATMTITSGGHTNVQGVCSNEGGTISNFGEIAIDYDGTFDNGPFSDFFHLSTASVSNFGHFNNAGTVFMTSAEFENWTSVQNDGDWNLIGQVDNFGDFNNNGAITLFGIFINHQEALVSNHAVIDITANGTCVSGGIFNSFQFGEILISGAFNTLSTSTSTNHGLINIYASGFIDNSTGAMISSHGPVYNAGEVSNSGTIYAFDTYRNNGLTDNYHVFTMQPGGDLQLKPGSFFHNHAAAVVRIK